MQANTNIRPDRNRIHPVGTAIELCFIVVAFVLLNAFPDKVGFIRSFTEPSSFVPLLSPDFQTHMPLLNLYWSLAFSLGVANLVTLRWNIGTRWLDLALRILGIFVLIELVLGGPLTMYAWMDRFIKFGLAIAVIPIIIDALRKLNDLLGGWQFTVQPK